MREVKEKIAAERSEPSKPSNPRRRQRSAAAQMLPFSSFGRSCARQRRTVSRKIATRAARSQTPPTMPCRKSAIWQKKAAHRLPKTKSEPQREARTESVPQHEQSGQPQQPTVAPKEYPPARASPRKSVCARIGFSDQGEAGSSSKRPTAQNARIYAGCESASVPVSVSNSEDS